MNIRSLYPLISLSVLYLLTVANQLRAQIPTDIDPGQNENPVNLYEEPKYIIPILTLFVILIGFYFWQKRNKK